LSSSSDRGAALEGLTVLEIGHFVAAPFCTRLLADLGAEVIKIEPVTGDPVRSWGEQIDGQSLWWSIHGRNKKSVAIDIKAPEGRDAVLALLPRCDVLVENFRPGQLDRYGFDEVTLRAHRPDLIIARISGYGQDGPYRDRAAFGVIGEAIGGLRYLTNHPPDTHGLPPVRVGISIGDSIAGLYAAFGIVSALWQRERSGGARGPRLIDVALTESILSMTEAMLPEFGRLGKVKQPTGGGIATAAPSNAYPTSDGGFVLIAANSQPLFARLAKLLGREDLSSDPRFRDNPGRVANSAELDRMIADWSYTMTAGDLIAVLEAADIPASKAYTARDIADDPQFRERGMVREVEDPTLGPILHTGIVPQFRDGPGAIRWTGPMIGAHSEEVLAGAGLSSDRISDLREKGVIR
jgi:crotonobetainyl-CoA:carnitine CoA-transferase CaiB-like acyl-CoA transferase